MTPTLPQPDSRELRTVRLTIPGHVVGKKNASWTEGDCFRLKLYYKNTKPSDFSLDVIAAKLDRTRFAVSIKAGRLGLSDKYRKFSDASRATMSRAWRNRSEDLQHTNRGRRFGPYTEERKLQMGAIARSNWDKWKATGTGPMSKENRKKQRETMALLRVKGLANEGPTRAKGGRRADLNDMFFRSSWEANIARYLNWLIGIGAVEEWLFEKETFWFSGVRKGSVCYTPDFKIKFTGDPDYTFWEVKGWMDPKSKTKLKRMKKYFPAVKLIVIGEAEYNEIKRKAKSLLPGWEGSR